MILWQTNMTNCSVVSDNNPCWGLRSDHNKCFFQSHYLSWSRSLVSSTSDLLFSIDIRSIQSGTAAAWHGVGRKKENNPAGISLFKVNIKNTRSMCGICSKLAIKTLKQRQWRLSGIFIVNFEQIPHIVLIFPLLTLNKLMPAGPSCS